ncbi:DUF6631 family protein [Pasteurella multocida]|uniref:DUF6631 family protein n=1 Tax=Pasteurella multocida TaxID=747 RepID=UPI0028DEE415|nr:hypothetical protein [Pasteurella multocida]HDR1154160.1 hypothetical protein [Pasteurella multocida]HDR1157483.1 hypothetical protein [Pasteurella multocida]HDR1165652.1 hypothetical protein [Pasteurella multocida]HDR1505011.1 hypothetical protein [Pasteurella multocida]
MTKTAKDELNILFPNAKINIAGIEVEVKEYTLLQQLQHHEKLMPFIHVLRHAMADKKSFSLDKLMFCISQNYQDVIELVALSTNQSVEFVQNLKGEEAESLLMLWWTVNSDFFTRKVLQPTLEKMAMKQVETLTSASSSST